MNIEPLRAVPVLVPDVGPPPLDYYLVLPRHDDSGAITTVDGIVVEEFTRHHDFTTTGLDSAAWTPEAGWCSSAALSRAMRTAPEVLTRVLPTSRREAEDVHRALGGGQLPAEAVLRTHFLDHQPIASAPPLRLGPAQAPAGFHERRVYRVLFAGDLRAEQVASLADAGGRHEYGLGPATVRRQPGLGSRRDSPAEHRCGRGGGLDPDRPDERLHEHGLIPVTSERFS
ncbi:hypothetical protein AB0877_00285 [Micromonospora sp. NPDC047644]|uniref:hypothetical protein n=1 Tax=Micromonospora sp. NPDC047644 TaxID=3157203 RepID=UPI0034525004